MQLFIMDVHRNTGLTMHEVRRLYHHYSIMELIYNCQRDKTSCMCEGEQRGVVVNCQTTGAGGKGGGGKGGDMDRCSVYRLAHHG